MSLAIARRLALAVPLLVALAGCGAGKTGNGVSLTAASSAPSSATPTPSADAIPSSGQQPVVVGGRLQNDVSYGSDLQFTPTSAIPVRNLSAVQQLASTSGIYGDVATAASSSTGFFANYVNSVLPAPAGTGASGNVPVWVMVYHGITDKEGVSAKYGSEVHDIVYVMSDLTGQLIQVVSAPGPS